MPVTFDAAENEPIFSGRSGVPVELHGQLVEVDVAVAVLADRDQVRDRLAPRELVAVVLERPDEHDRALVGRDPRAQVPAVVEVGRDAQVEHVDEAVDRGRRPGAAEDHRVALGVAADPVQHEPPRLLAEARGLEPRAGRLGVRVRVQRQDGVADEVLDEAEAPPRGRVVGVGDAPDAVRPGHRLVVADHRRPDEVDERVGPGAGPVVAVGGRCRPAGFHVASSLGDAHAAG